MRGRPTVYVAQPLLPTSHQSQQNQAEGRTAKMQDNPTQLSKQMDRPEFYCLSDSLLTILLYSLVTSVFSGRCGRSPFGKRSSLNLWFASSSSLSASGGNCIKIGLPGKSILRDYFHENRTSRRPFLKFVSKVRGQLCDSRK